jgi:hypothetical protein
MSIVGETARAAALECAELGVPLISPWRMDVTNKDHLHRGLEECGCGFCPDEPRDGDVGLKRLPFP